MEDRKFVFTASKVSSPTDYIIHQNIILIYRLGSLKAASYDYIR